MPSSCARVIRQSRSALKRPQSAFTSRLRQASRSSDGRAAGPTATCACSQGLYCTITVQCGTPSFTKKCGVVDNTSLSARNARKPSSSKPPKEGEYATVNIRICMDRLTALRRAQNTANVEEPSRLFPNAPRWRIYFTERSRMPRLRKKNPSKVGRVPPCIPPLSFTLVAAHSSISALRYATGGRARPALRGAAARRPALHCAIKQHTQVTKEQGEQGASHLERRKPMPKSGYDGEL